jgi:hypothetical protein
MFGNSVNVQSKLFNLTLFYGFPAFPFIRLTMWKEGLQQQYFVFDCHRDVFTV